MNRAITLMTLLAALAAALLSGPPVLAGDQFVPHQIIVELEDEEDDINEIVADYPEILGVLAGIETQGIYLLLLRPDVNEEDFAEFLDDNDERIDEADLNYDVEGNEGQSQSFFLASTRQAYNGSYVRPRIRLGAAHTVTRGAGVVVAVLDTGLDATHEVVLGRTLAGYNAFDGSSDVADIGNGLDDDNDGFIDEMVGHGTFVAGLILTIAPEARVLPIKVLDSDGIGNSFLVTAGIYHAIERTGPRVDVINLSMSNRVPSPFIGQAIIDARAAGIVVVTASGNYDQEEPIQFPAESSDAICVAATDEHDVKAPLSNYGDYVDVSAPGERLVSAFPGQNYAEASGTSMASAVAAGAAALVLSVNPNWTRDSSRLDETMNVLRDTSDPIDHLNLPIHHGKLGAGRINAAAAVGASVSIAELTGITMLTGQIRSGGLAELRLSDDLVLRTRSGFGRTFTDLHNMELAVHALAPLVNPTLMDLKVESRISHAAGTARLRLWNWPQNRYDVVSTYAIGQTENTRHLTGLNATRYVAADGRIDLAIRHVVVVPVFAFTFDSFIDHVEMMVFE